jgi:inner membrane protein
MEDEEIIMANAAEHALYGGLAGGVTYLVMCQYYERQPDLLELLICSGAAVLSGGLPDAIEPAIHPHHRQFAHSFTTGGILLRIATYQCGVENSGLGQFQKILLASAIAGYLSHLIADACTPRCVPLV